MIAEKFAVYSREGKPVYHPFLAILNVLAEASSSETELVTILALLTTSEYCKL